MIHFTKKSFPGHVLLSQLDAHTISNHREHNYFRCISFYNSTARDGEEYPLLVWVTEYSPSGPLPRGLEQ